MVLIKFVYLKNIHPLIQKINKQTKKKKNIFEVVRQKINKLLSQNISIRFLFISVTFTF